MIVSIYVPFNWNRNADYESGCVAGLLSGPNTDINTSATLYNPTDGTCILLTDDICPNQAANTYSAVFSTEAIGDQFTLSNSNCGQVTTSADVATLGQ